MAELWIRSRLLIGYTADDMDECIVSYQDDFYSSDDVHGSGQSSARVEEHADRTAELRP